MTAPLSDGLGQAVRETATSWVMAGGVGQQSLSLYTSHYHPYPNRPTLELQTSHPHQLVDLNNSHHRYSQQLLTRTAQASCLSLLSSRILTSYDELHCLWAPIPCASNNIVAVLQLPRQWPSATDSLLNKCYLSGTYWAPAWLQTYEIKYPSPLLGHVVN
ncbi:hypothetical protein CDD82_625 [Ophiocordyceps australis]|uniref:Uncharacterized protein n=1 Tax=Ophiocordyceps australis TaxID=1399860 RepID=A0A2C5YKW2_9HYPO|nr:hypothetical protein CDD82_625 [Ophiocordyceps australis]